MLRRIHGNKDHSDVAALLYVLAQVYLAQGRLDDCASLHEELLVMKRRIHGSKDHSEVAVLLCSVAQVYKAQGRLDDSASLHEESLAMYRRIHGSKDHSSVAVSLGSLAQVYAAQGRLDDSASLREESLATIGGSMAARTTAKWLYRCDASLSAYHLNLATAALVAQSQTTRRSCSTHPPTVCLFCVHSQSRTVDLAQGVGIVVLCLQNVTLHFLCCSFDCSAVLCS